MKLLLSCVFAISVFVSPTNESEHKLVKKVSNKSVAFKRGSIPNSKVSYTVVAVSRGRYVKIEFINDYDKPVLIEGVIDGVLIEGSTKDYKIRMKPNSRKSILIRQIRRKIYPAEECNNFSPYDACADTKREILFNYNRFDTSLISVLNHKVEVLEKIEKKELEGTVGRTILR